MEIEIDTARRPYAPSVIAIRGVLGKDRHEEQRNEERNDFARGDGQCHGGNGRSQIGDPEDGRKIALPRERRRGENKEAEDGRSGCRRQHLEAQCEFPEHGREDEC